jgi:cation:H+ antiporter
MLFNHAFLFFLALSIIWILSGSVISAVDRVARRYEKPGFAVAFFVLGFMTTIGEMSVAFNSTIKGIPQVSAGNLIGASIVIFLLIIPLLAIFSKGISLSNAMTNSNLLLTLSIILLPALVTFDGMVSPQEGLLIILLYIALIYRIRKKHSFETTVESTIAEVREAITHKRRATAIDLLHITGAAVVIFLAGNVLVEKSVFFTTLWGVPASVAGLLVLSIGTNVPELIIAVRSVLLRHADIAFGDYLGSGAANSLLFGILALANGTFLVHQGEFLISLGILLLGLILFLVFARSKEELSRKEGIIMSAVYVCFLVGHIVLMMG